MGLSTGCIFGLGGGDPTDPTQLEGCAPAGADIDAHVQISLDFQQSMHELVVCGGLTIKVSVAASEALYQLIFASAVNALPPEFSYQGDGLYRTGDASTDMGLGFVFGADYEVSTNDEGEIEVKSRYLFEPSRPPRVVAVSLGGATGPESPAPRYADVPIPTPRPDYAPPVEQGG